MSSAIFSRAGGGADELLIAGTSSFDANDTALAAILAEWASTRDYLTRVANLRGAGSGPRANDNYFLSGEIGGVPTVFDDLAADRITGAGGRDWFFAKSDDPLADFLVDRATGELLDGLL